MKLSKEFMVKANYISKKDASFRLAEYKEHKNLKPNIDNYPIEEMKKIWPTGNFFSFGNVDGLFGELNGKILFIFRGSDSLGDWIKNFFIAKKIIPYEEKGTNKKIKVHAGFYFDYLKVRNFIHGIIKTTNLKEIVFHGHSRGAALAILGALDIQYNFNDKEIGCFTAGGPKVGNKYFKQSVERRMPDLIRIEYGNDLVPKALPEVFNFYHVGKLFHFGPKLNCKIGNMDDHGWDNYYNSIVEFFEDDKFYP